MSRHLSSRTAHWRAGMLACAILAGTLTHAQVEWTGAGADDSWGTADNWATLTVPPTPYTGRILFTTNDLGNTSQLEADRTITGTASGISQGLHVNLTGATGDAGHNLDLNDKTLTLNGGSLQVGYNASNSVMLIHNGTLNLGGPLATDLFVGVGNVPSGFFPGSALTIDTATLDTAKAGTMAIGRSINGSRSWQGLLDLRGATIRAGERPDTLALSGDLLVGTGYASQSSPRTIGQVLFPAALKSIEARDFFVGYDRNNTGIIDFGTTSQLTNLTVRRNFYLSCGAGSGESYLQNMPTNVNITVGTANAPGVVWLAQHDGWDAINHITGKLSVVSARFTAHLSDLSIGRHKGSNQGNPHGILDVQQAVVRIGSSADHMIQVPLLMIGSRLFSVANQGSASVDGLFKIPAAVTNLTCGSLYLGNGANGRGVLDIGKNSQLRTLTITNGLYMGGGEARIGHESETGWLEYLPIGIAVTLGQPGAPVPVHIGRRPAGQYPHYAETYSAIARLVLTNGSLSASISELSVGAKEDSTKSVLGVLDLREATVPAFTVYGSAFIGAETNQIYGTTPATSANQNGKGYVHLRDAVGEIKSSLYLGDTHATSFGLLDLDRTTLTVHNALDINTTGLLSNQVYGVASGIDLTSAATNTLRIAAGGRLHLVFREDPVDRREACWGLRLRGDQRDLLQELVSEPARLTWDTADLSAENGRRIGIHYDPVRDITLVGLDRTRGTVVLVR